MKRIFRIATIVVVVLWAPVSYASSSNWCFKPEVKEAFDRAKVVFLGEVIEVVPPRSTEPTAKFVDSAHTIKFKVESAWKGLFWTEARVLFQIDRSFRLGELPQKGEKYLVYAEPVYRYDPSSTEVMTHSCTRTALLSEKLPANGFYYRNQAVDDIRVLNSMVIIFPPRAKPVLSRLRLER